MAGVTINPANVPSIGFPSGTDPIGILADKAGTHLYVTDQALNQIATYSLANGVPTLVGTTATDAGPMGMAFDLSGKYLYVVAYTANAIDGYTFNASGVPVRSTVAGSVQTGTGPTCVTVSGAPSNANPTHAEYLYTSNSLSNNLTGEQVNQSAVEGDGRRRRHQRAVEVVAVHGAEVARTTPRVDGELRVEPGDDLDAGTPEAVQEQCGERRGAQRPQRGTRPAQGLPRREADARGGRRSEPAPTARSRAGRAARATRARARRGR